MADGSSCDPRDPWKMCAEGHCLSTGCDHVLGSTIETDRCGNCGGDGKFCQFVSESYSPFSSRRKEEMLSPPLQNYNLLASIPRGSKDIRITSVGSISFLGQNEWVFSYKEKHYSFVLRHCLGIFQMDFEMTFLVLENPQSSLRYTPQSSLRYTPQCSMDIILHTLFSSLCSMIIVE